MRNHWIFNLGLTLALAGTACTPGAAKVSGAPSATRSAPTAFPTNTLTPTRVPTATRRPTATPVPTRTPTPPPTPIAIVDPRLAELERHGYERVDLAGFTVNASTSGMAFGGPDSNHQVPQLVSGPLAYLQYANPDTQDCVLVFARSADSGYAVIDAISASGLNDRLHAMLSPTTDYGLSPVFCSPLGWGDANENGLPDMAVTFLWANQYTGSEAHLFEVRPDDTVIDLFADLPGIVSPWEYDPSESILTVFDLQWAGHDCIYPPTAIVWVYTWRDGRYVDITAERDLSRYLRSLQASVEQYVGQPFNPYLTIEPLTQLLIIHERIGQREAGWELYVSLTDQKNWPDTDEASAAWLQSDVEHFTGEYQAGVPFTANDYCAGP